MNRLQTIVCVCALLAACGGENNESTTNNATSGTTNTTSGTNNTAGTNNTLGSNNTAGTSGTTGTNNTAGTNNTTGTNNPTTNNTVPINNANPGVEVTEVEPNDDGATATRFMPNDTLIGTTSNMDDDFFAIDLVGGSIFEIEMTEVQLDGEMYADFLDVTMTVPERTAGATEGDARQFFIPMSGRYLLRLTDLTASPGNYKITTTVKPAAPIAGYTVPSIGDGDLNDYAIDIYNYTATEDATVRAGITADRSPVLSDMDAMLMVYSPSERRLIAINDDLGAQTVDPEVTYEQSNGATYWLVVDGVYLEPGGDNSYQLASEIP